MAKYATCPPTSATPTTPEPRPLSMWVRDSVRSRRDRGPAKGMPTEARQSSANGGPSHFKQIRVPEASTSSAGALASVSKLQQASASSPRAPASVSKLRRAPPELQQASISPDDLHPRAPASSSKLQQNTSTTRSSNRGGQLPLIFYVSVDNIFPEKTPCATIFTPAAGARMPGRTEAPGLSGAPARHQY